MNRDSMEQRVVEWYAIVPHVTDCHTSDNLCA